MAINGQQNINIGAPNDPVGSDSLFTAFTKTQNNFNTLFSLSSPINNVTAGNGINVNTLTSSAITITNTGVTKLIAGNNISITNTSGLSENTGELIINATGGGGSGSGGTVTSVGLISSSLEILGGPITVSGNIQVNLPNQSLTPGLYTNPTLTVDSKGRITTIASGNGGNGGGGNVSSVAISGGFGIEVTGSPITSSGVININNTGVTRLSAGPGILVNQSNGNVTVSSISSGTVTSIGIISNTLSITGGPITTSGSIKVELPAVVPNAIFATNAGFTNNANIANSASFANTSNTANTATFATTANTANFATTAATANTASTANTANTATFASSSNTSNFATSSGTANTATTATTANFANTAATANTATNANFANTAATANTAINVTSATQSNITSLGTLTSLNVSGNASFTGSRVALGNVSVVRITGGTSGQVLSTDGTGNLSWITQSGGSGNATPGGANTQIQFNDAGIFGATGNLTFNKSTSALVVGGNISSGGNISATGNLSAGNISVGNANFTGSNVTLGSVSSVRITGGSSGQVLSTNGSGTLSWITPSGGGGNATPSGANTQIQFNDAGVFGANANLTFNKSTSALTVGGNITASAVVTTGTGVSTITSSGDIILNCFGGSGQVNSTGNIRASAGANGGGFVIGKIVSNSTAPTLASSTGVAGQIAFDSNYVYICVAANTWKRAAISTF